MPYSRASANRVFAYALFASLVLHGVLLVLEWPRFTDALRHPIDVLTPIVARLVEPAPPLAQPAPPAPSLPAPAPAPPPAKEQAAAGAKPPPKPKPRITAKPQPAPAALPTPRADPAPAPSAPPAPAPAPAPLPAPVAKAAPQPSTESPAPQPAPLDTAALTAQYRSALIAEARRLRRYPLQAQDNGWEGEVGVRITIAADGSVSAVRATSSSGYRLLDREAVAMFRRALGRVAVPPELRGQEFSLELRAVFNLKDQASG